MAVHIGRREFLVTISSAGAWPLAVRAQEPALPVIGFVNPASARSFARPLSAFLNGASIPGAFSRARNQLICRCSRRRGGDVHQPQDGQGARHHHPAAPVRPRR
jgi:hypothetical protein